MKISLIVFVLLLSPSFELFSQEKTEEISKHFIGLIGGYSNLSGNLIKNDYSDSSSGYASSNGFNIGIEGVYFIKRNFGLGVLISTNSFSSNGLQTLADGYQEDFEVDSITLEVTGRYGTYNFFAGPYFSIPKGKFTFDLKIFGGLVSAFTPEYKVDIEDQIEATFYQRSSSTLTFGIQSRLAVRYSVSTNFSLKFGVDYFYAKPDFEITNENRCVNVGRKITEYNESFMILNANLGLVYQFGK